MLLTWANSQGANALLNSAEFIAGFADKGSGEVDLTLSRGTGSATFTRATTATTVDSTGTIVSVASGTPRSYYDPTTLAYLGYLTEGARTNLCLQSEDLATTWAASNVTVSTNATTSPDGTANADLITPTTAVTTTHRVFQTITLSAVAHAFTVRIKPNGYTKFGIRETSVAGYYATFNTATVSVLDSGTGGTGSIRALQNGWYEVTMLFTATAGANIFSLYPLDDAYTTGSPTAYNYTANGTSGVYVWGAQLEAGAFASSYIPTTTASVTRNADVLTYPTSGNVTGTVGSAYAEVSTFWTAGTSQRVVDIGTNSPPLFMNTANIAIFDGTSIVNGPAFTGSTSIQKAASSWGGSTKQVALFGVAAASGSFDGDMNVGANIFIGSNGSSGAQWFGTIRNVRIFQSQLSSGQLSGITA